MTVSTSVKWAVSSMAGAPTLSGTAGSLITLLDAFLVNGFGTKAVDSATVTDGICRMNITGGSAAQDHCVIQLAGVTGDGVTLNGEQRVTAATANYVEFPCDLPDGPLTGAITFKMAPLGWEKVFSKNNVAVYRSVDVAGTRAYYRVDDTNALYATVRMYEEMTDVDTGSGVSPTNANAAFIWTKRQSAAATGVYWVMVGDSRGFYLGVAPHANTTAASPAGYGLYGYYAGDLNSYRSGDAWCAALTGSPVTTYSDTAGCVFSSGLSTGMCVQRQSHGIGNGVLCSRTVWGNAAANSGADGSQGVFPSRVDNGLRLSPIVISDGVLATNGPRGELPGVYHCPQTGVVAAYPADVRLTDGSGAFAGSKLLSFGCGTLSGAMGGVAFIDVTAPWRG